MLLPELLHVLLGMVSSLFQGIQDGMEEAVHAIIDAFGFERDKRFLSTRPTCTLARGKRRVF